MQKLSDILVWSDLSRLISNSSRLAVLHWSVTRKLQTEPDKSHRCSWLKVWKSRHFYTQVVHSEVRSFMLDEVCMMSKFSSVKFRPYCWQNTLRSAKLFQNQHQKIALVHMQNKLCLIWNYQVKMERLKITQELSIRNLNHEFCNQT